MLSNFYLAAVPEPVTLLGLKLRPYSLGHKLLLHRIESAFVCGGPVTYTDLAASIFICAQTYHEALASFSDPALPRFMAHWHRKLTGNLWWRRLLHRSLSRFNVSCFKLTPVDLQSKSKAFANYLEAGSQVPYYEIPADKSGSSQIETVQAVQLALMAKTSLTEAEILDRPWGRCLYDYLALNAMEDRCTIFDGQPAAERRNAIAEAQALANSLAKKLNPARNGSD